MYYNIKVSLRIRQQTNVISHQGNNRKSNSTNQVDILSKKANSIGIDVIFVDLFVFCHHFLNSPRSATTCLSRFTDEKELNLNPFGGAPGTGYIFTQTIDELEVHAARPHVFQDSRMRGI